MKFHYYPDTDTLYISLIDKPSVDSQKVADGIVLDFDDQGKLVGIDIDHASQVVDLSRLEAQSLPLANLALASQA
jgi:uncharacterized protein YuzE